MSNGHLSDEDIQQYVSGITNCGAGIIAHIHDCEECLAKAETYKLLFVGLKEQPKPVFDFDVSELVLPQIFPVEKQVSKITVFAIVSFVIAAATVAAYLYRTSLDKLLKKYVLQFSSGISKGVMYLVITTALTFLLFQAFELFKKYQRKINELNLQH